MSNSRKSSYKRLMILSSVALSLLSAASVQAAEHNDKDRHVDYGDGIKMTEYEDNSGFLITVDHGPSLQFDKSTQQVVITELNGSKKVVNLDKPVSLIVSK